MRAHRRIVHCLKHLSQQQGQRRDECRSTFGAQDEPGSGSAHRRLPTGGCANGIPLKSRASGATMPCSVPDHRGTLTITERSFELAHPGTSLPCPLVPAPPPLAPSSTGGAPPSASREKVHSLTVSVKRTAMAASLLRVGSVVLLAALLAALGCVQAQTCPGAVPLS